MDQNDDDTGGDVLTGDLEVSRVLAAPRTAGPSGSGPAAGRQPGPWRRCGRAVMVVAAVVALVVWSGGQPEHASAQQRPARQVGAPVVPKSQDIPLQVLAPPRDVQGAGVPGRPPIEVPEGSPGDGGRVGPNPVPGPDPVRQRSTRPGQKSGQGESAASAIGATASRISDPLVNFDGIDFTGFIPPDTVGDVGPNHYVQLVNVSYAIFSKSGTVLAGPAPIDTLWAGAGGACETDGGGDPIVVYDQAADRWLVSQFAFASTDVPPWYECIAISKTGDPVSGGWWLYEFETSGFPDYPKFGVWPDAYYMSTYEGNDLGVFAFDRARMLNGQAATYVSFVIESLAGVRQTRILPADWDGPTPPPAGAPGYFMRSVDGAVWGGGDRLEVFEFDVDFVTPLNSTFTSTRLLTTAAFDANLCGFDRNCIPQPGTAVRLDTLSNRLMHRLQYRNFGGGDERMVVNQTVDTGDFQDHAGVRWYELRGSGGVWNIHQESTYAPDARHRFMGSAAMDKRGNIAVGYSIGDGALFPSVSYAGRLLGDLPHTLPHDEKRLVTGNGSQTFSNRWGDYSALNVDPVDDCTFWYTQQYIPDSSGEWRTRIGSFRFPSCIAGPPANDAFAGALPLTFGQTSLDTAAAVTEAGEPVAVDAACGAATPGTLGHSVWYTFTPARTRAVTLSTAGSNFDTFLAVYTGNAVGTLTRVGCNDDAAGGAQSLVTFTPTAGTTYHVQVGGYNAASGDLTLSFVEGVVLTVTKSGTGSGAVTTTGLDCGDVCTQSYPVGTTVTLQATPGPRSTFAGWGGACTGTGPCSVTLSADTAVSATFTAFPVLTVNRTGAGVGTVTGSGIDCGTDCQEQLVPGTPVTLTAAPARGTTFTGWGGACASAGTHPTCSLIASEDQTVTAAFGPTNAGVQVGRAPGETPGAVPRLLVTLTARAGCGPLTRVQFGEAGRPFDNASVSIVAPGGGPSGQTSGFTVTPPAGTTSVVVTVERVAQSGGATVTPIRMTDGCGDWQTFVGGGAEAFQ